MSIDGRLVENKMNTKDAILYTSLSLFSEKGYEGVSMRDIAAAIGIKAASIYNHYKSKEDIFNSLLIEMDRRYEDMVEALGIPTGDGEMVKLYAGINEDMLQKLATNLFIYFLKDEFAAPFRRMLTAEQYRNSVAGDTFRQIFVDGAVEFQTHLFALLMQNGTFIEEDPYTAALHFYAPIFLLLTKYDKKPKLENEAIEKLNSHVRAFSHAYAK